MIHESKKILIVQRRSMAVKIHRSESRVLYTHGFEGGGAGVALGADRV